MVGGTHILYFGSSKVNGKIK